MGDVLVRGGRSSTAPAGRASSGDVRVRDGIIAEVGRAAVAPDGETVIDAAGALVTPGLIDPHTHYDLEMFWDPTLDPLPSYGMTTIVMGNCGLGIAPVRDDVRDDIADLLCFIEELPVLAVDEVRAVGLEHVVRVPRGRVADAHDRHAVRVHRAQRVARLRAWAATRGSVRRPTPSAS